MQWGIDFHTSYTPWHLWFSLCIVFRLKVCHICANKMFKPKRFYYTITVNYWIRLLWNLKPTLSPEEEFFVCFLYYYTFNMAENRQMQKNAMYDLPTFSSTWQGVCMQFIFPINTCIEQSIPIPPFKNNGNNPKQSHSEFLMLSILWPLNNLFPQLHASGFTPQPFMLVRVLVSSYLGGRRQLPLCLC